MLIALFSCFGVRMEKTKSGPLGLEVTVMRVVRMVQWGMMGMRRRRACEGLEGIASSDEGER